MLLSCCAYSDMVNKILSPPPSKVRHVHKCPRWTCAYISNYYTLSKELLKKIGRS